MFEMNSMKQNANGAAEPRQSATTTSSHGGPATMAMIGSTLHIKGEVRGKESLVIQGQVEGTIDLEGDKLIIGQEGRINATVHARSITIEGNLQGDVFGAERVMVKRTADVRGNISAPQVSMEEGAKFKGSIDMDYKAPAVSHKDTQSSAAVYKFDASTSDEKTSVKQGE
jgi:cytoskeletal protein CcmA (bactofilin family)